MPERWIKMQCGLLTHPAVVTIASRLDVTRANAVGLVFHFWSVLDEHGELPSEAEVTSIPELAGVGPLLRMTTEALDDLLGVVGFCDAMKAVDWLAVVDSGLMAPRYHDHNGPNAKARAQSQKRSQSSRHRRASATPSSRSGVTGSPSPSEQGEEGRRRADCPAAVATAAAAWAGVRSWPKVDVFHRQRILKAIKTHGPDAVAEALEWAGRDGPESESMTATMTRAARSEMTKGEAKPDGRSGSNRGAKDSARKDTGKFSRLLSPGAH